MKKIWIVFSALCVMSTAPAPAQGPEDRPGRPDPNAPRTEQRTGPNRVSPAADYPHISPGELQATPEMWFYQQALRQYQDPKLAVRQAAEFRAEQRQRRLAAMKWFGLSNQRPHASSDPIHTDYSPRWTSNNSYYPDRWAGTSGAPLMVVRPDGARAY